MGLFDAFGVGGGKVSIQLQSATAQPGGVLAGAVVYTAGKRPQNITVIKIRLVGSQRSMTSDPNGQPRETTNTHDIVPAQAISGAFTSQPGQPQQFPFSLTVPNVPGSQPGVLTYRIQVSADIDGEVDPGAGADVNIIGPQGALGGVQSGMPQQNMGPMAGQMGFAGQQQGYGNQPQGGYVDKSQVGYGSKGGWVDPSQGGYADKGAYVDKSQGGYGDKGGGYVDPSQGGYGDKGGYVDKSQSGYGDKGGGYVDPSQGGYGDKGGYVDKSQSGYDDKGGGYVDPSQGGYGDKGGYVDKSHGGYQDKSGGGFVDKSHGGYQDKSGGGFVDKSHGAYQNKSGGGFVDKSQPTYMDKSVAQPGGGLVAGSACVAQWQDGNWYPARIAGMANGMYGVDWDDPNLGASTWVQPAQVQAHGQQQQQYQQAPAALAVGAHCIAQWQDGNWYPGRVAAINNGMYGVDWDDPNLGQSTWVQSHQAVVG